MLPNFLVIGAMKAGTDSLWEYLRRHPQVFMSSTKELDFFVEDLNWTRGMTWYESQFSDAEFALAVGEASTSYAKSPVYAGVPGRVHQVLPDARLVYLVRHPIDRIRSQYQHQRLLRLERRPIDAAVLSDPSYVAFSSYSMQIGRYLEAFDRSRLLTITSDSLRNDRTACLTRVLRFLGVDADWTDPIVSEEFHSSADKRVLRGPFAVVHRIPGHERIARRIPHAIKESTERIRTRGVDSRAATMARETTLRLEDALRDDVRSLGAYVDGDFDGWGLI